MRSFTIRSALAGTVFLSLLAGAALAGGPFVQLSTEAGEILLELQPDLAPHHVDNFVRLCRRGFYDGTYFHRVIPGFMIQGGDPNTKNDDPRDDGQGGPTWADVLPADLLARVQQVNADLAALGYRGLGDAARLTAEFNKAHHVRGVLSMARAGDPNSAGSQFFICVADAPYLDGKYTAFGRVVAGMDVADAIVEAPRDAGDRPLQPVHITGTRVIEDESGLSDAQRKAWESARTRQP